MASKKRKTAGTKRKTTRKKLATKGLSKRKATSKKKAVPKKLQQNSRLRALIAKLNQAEFERRLL